MFEATCHASKQGKLAIKTRTTKVEEVKLKQRSIPKSDLKINTSKKFTSKSNVITTSH